MRIFLAGGSGVVGRRLLPQLQAAGHQVSTITRRPERTDALRATGAEPAEHEAGLRPQRPGTRVGSANLVAATEAAGVRRFVAQNVSIMYAPDGPAVADEDAGWRLTPPSRLAARCGCMWRWNGGV